MSYILEALKMSEQSRRQRVDGLHYSLLPAVEEGIATRPFRPYLWLAGALLINATAVALWWRPVLPAAASAEIQIVKALPESAAAMPRAPAPPSLTVSVPAPAALPALLPEPLPGPLPVLSVVANQPPAPLGTRPTAATTKPPQARLRATAPEKADEAASRSDNADGTSASLMKQLPPINVAGYIRDAEANRLVMVNDRLLREGDELAPGLKLEKILDDSLVFNFRGHRFKR
jgi:general secretion pathway protein B